MSSPREQYLNRLACRLHRTDYDIARGASIEWLMVHVGRLSTETSMLHDRFQDHWMADHILARIADILESVETLVLEKIESMRWNADASTEITYLSEICDAKAALHPNPNPNPNGE